jgi:glycosyltransferase involved in cell wall biosynthesis
MAREGTSESAEPLVTVLIATYNRSSVLRCAIESVLWQTLNDFELWVIGDGCTDDSADVVATFEDPRVHWYNLPRNSGYQSEPNNEGLRRAKGKYVAYLNHDDLWLPNHLQVLVHRIEETGADFVFCVLEKIRASGESHVEIPEYPHAPLPPHATATLHRRDVIKDIGYWKKPSEVHAFPRVDYFRQAQFVGKRFELAPFLTALMFFDSRGGDYAAAGLQPRYLAMIREDPDFAHKRLAALLASAHHELEHPIRLRRLRIQVLRSMQRACIRRGLEPERLRFWAKPGRRVRDWRKRHGLEPA